MLQGAWKQHLRPRAVVGYGVKIFLPSPPNYVTRSPGGLSESFGQRLSWDWLAWKILLKLLWMKQSVARTSTTFINGGAFVILFCIYVNTPKREKLLIGIFVNFMTFCVDCKLILLFSCPKKRRLLCNVWKFCACVIWKSFIILIIICLNFTQLAVISVEEKFHQGRVLHKSRSICSIYSIYRKTDCCFLCSL